MALSRAAGLFALAALATAWVAIPSSS